ncbi:MAG: hypothetical protein KC619_29740 [Myxococcales bacterium]|nr:hypothetical protein [Myxococcales bacterium]
MTKRKKQRRKPSRETAAAAPERETSPPKPPLDWREIGTSYGLLLLGAILMFLGFAGFGVWPLAFVGMVPVLWVMDQHPTKGWAFFRRALFFGYVAWYGGFYWVVDTIVDFGGFPYLLAAFFASVYFLYQALQYVLMLWLYRRARERGFEATLSLVVAFVASEMVVPAALRQLLRQQLPRRPAARAGRGPRGAAAPQRARDARERGRSTSLVRAIV